MEARIQRLQRLGLASIGVTILLMMLGAWVKATGSGLACPDWPACYGEWLPPFPSSENGGTYQGEPVLFTQAQILYEWGHRAVVSLLLVPLLAFAIVAARGTELRPALRWLPLGAVGLYVLQAGLGAVTVVTGNPPWATTAHLTMAVAFLLVQTVATCAAFFAPTLPTPPAPPAEAREPPPGFVQPRPFSGFTWPEAPKP
ncbi:MAG: COX15/CtaA family protein [Candidatus Thermoplasmatota archaeon]